MIRENKKEGGEKMKVVIGLGNPGKKYEKTRHNIGFIAVDSLRKKFNISDEREKFQALVSEKNIDGEKVIFFKPQTFMNLSGNSVIEIINFYKLDPKKDIIVIYDDMDLSFGDIRIREKGSSGGHNGIKSIISHIGEEFIRIKCGIGAKEKDAVEHVLGEFNQTEQKDLDEILEKINNCVIEMLSVQNLDRIMQKYNKKKEKLK